MSIFRNEIPFGFDTSTELIQSGVEVLSTGFLSRRVTPYRHCEEVFSPMKQSPDPWFTDKSRSLQLFHSFAKT